MFNVDGGLSKIADAIHASLEKIEARDRRMTEAVERAGSEIADALYFVGKSIVYHKDGCELPIRRITK